jgi:putative proteasome-type protease
MTFCFAVKVKEALVGIADTRVTIGTQHIAARKLAIYQHGRHSLFLMTSGLRSARDKTLTYFEEVLEQGDSAFDRLYKAVNALAAQVRRVAAEDKEALAASGLPFNLYVIIGGQLENDKEHRLYLLYLQANWVEVGEGTPYFLIGESSYGKPILDRVLEYQSSMGLALKLGVLAFDSTRISATDVGFPIDVVLYRRDSHRTVQHRYENNDLAHLREWWQARLRQSVVELPGEWEATALSKLQD